MMRQEITNLSCLCRADEYVSQANRNSPALTMRPECCVSLVHDAIIPTLNGWASLSDVQMGDTVFDEQGNPCSVTAISERREEPAYRLSFDDGSSIEAGVYHPWLTRTWANRAGITKGIHRPAQWTSNFLPYTTHELEASLTHRSGGQDQATHSIPLAGALTLPERELPVDPYLLGMWLGDGTSKEAIITCSEEDEPHYRTRMLAIGENWRIMKGGERTLHCSLAGGASPRLRTRLRQLGVLSNKHVPQDYLFASSGQRLALLQGLMDSDGHIYETGRAEYVSTSQRLAEGTVEIVVSLGMKAAVTMAPAAEHRNQRQDVYRVRFSPTVCVASLPRKADRAREIIERRGRRKLSPVKQRYIKSVDNVGLRPVVCISVDSVSGIMLAGRQMLPILTRRWVP